jgi:hypothetical protein
LSARGLQFKSTEFPSLSGTRRIPDPQPGCGLSTSCPKKCRRIRCFYFFGNSIFLEILDLTGYGAEKSLSVDNIFVIAMIFGFFAVPAVYQHRVLFWMIAMFRYLFRTS